MTLIDAKAAGELLDVPHTWVLAEARGPDPACSPRSSLTVRFDPERLEGSRGAGGFRGRSRMADTNTQTTKRASDAPTPWPLTHKETKAPVSASNPNSRRSYGTGHLYVHTTKTGREQWYCRAPAGSWSTALLARALS